VATIRFLSQDMDKTVTCNAGGARRTLLALAREHTVPVLFNCEGGGCGACLVEVAVLTDAGHQQQLTFEEECLLRAMDKLDAEKGEEVAALRRRPRHRLACQYAVGDDDILVTFVSGLGSI
jgi:ferredoxin